MKYMIIGSCSKDERESNYNKFKEQCKEIAEVLLKEKATLIISSLFEDSADYWVFDEFSKVSQDIELHYLNIKSVNDRIKNVLGDLRISQYPYLDDSSQLELNYAYLFCQLNAMRNADAIIAIGGKENKSANLLLSFADRSKLIIPIIVAGGAAKLYYEMYKYKLEDFLGEKRDVLISGNAREILTIFISQYDQNKKTTISSGKSKRIFLSYARDNEKWADMTEVFLRRRNISIFRDESDFIPGGDTQKNIYNEIDSSDIVIALWCKEYACSPWCYDEIEYAMKKKKELWIICVDDTRIVPKKARKITRYEVKSRDELEGLITRLLEKSNGYNP